jgi:hypothetical protein
MEMITVTKELLEELRTPRGGYTRATTDALGEPWPLQNGWTQRVLGKQVPASIRETKLQYQKKHDMCLVGKWFYSEDGGCQGKVVGRPEAGIYLVHVSAGKSIQKGEHRLFQLADMAQWAFFETREAMIKALEGKDDSPF